MHVLVYIHILDTHIHIQVYELVQRFFAGLCGSYGRRGCLTDLLGKGGSGSMVPISCGSSLRLVVFS